jgi:hypothetical protein
MPGRKHTGDSQITHDITALKVRGNAQLNEFAPRDAATVYIRGDTNIDGKVDIQGELYVNDVSFSSISTTSITIPVGAVNGYVLTTNDSGIGTWKTPHWFTNDNPTGTTDPSDNIIWTDHNVAIGAGITEPDELLHVNATGAGDGAQIGSIFIGNDTDTSTDAIIVNSINKNNPNAYALKHESTGETHINSTENIDFRIVDNLVGKIDNNGNFGIGVTVPQELLHVGGNTIIDGDLTVNGNLTSINSSVIEVEDANLLLAINNPSDTLDIGVFGQYIEGGVTKFTGIYRDASSSDKHYELFQSLEEKPTTTVNIAASGYERANLRLNGLDVQSGITFSQINSNIKHGGLTISGDEPQIFLDTTGQIGIGVTTPTKTIDLIGGVNITEIYSINGIDVLSNDTLGTGVTQSNLEQVGTLNELTVTGTATFNGDTIINGDLAVLGGVTFNDAINIAITQPLLKLAVGNVDDILDTGFYSQYIDSGTTKFAGLFRDATDKEFKLFQGITEEPNPNIDLDTGDGEFANLRAGIITSTNRLSVTQGGHLEIGGDTVIQQYNLGSGVTSSNLQVVGDLESLNIIGDLTVDTNTLYVDSSNNKVGIGTITPDYQLDVTGTASIGALSLNANGNSDLALIQSGTNNIIFQNSSNGTLMTLTNTGNLGIGITNPVSQLQTSSDAEIGGDMTVQGNLTVNGTLTTIDSETVVIEDGMIKLANNNTSDTIDTGVYSQYNDGITKFAGYFRDSTDSIIKFYHELEVEPDTTVDTGATGFEYASLQSKDITLNEIKYTTDSSDLTFTNGGSTRAILTPNGFFGIGTTTSYPLHVSRLNLTDWSARFTNSATEVFLANSDGNGLVVNSGIANTNTNLNMNVRNATTNNVFVVRNDDKVGVLTSAPDRTFHVNISTTGDGGKFGDAFIGNWSGNATTASFSHDDLSQITNSYSIKQSSSGQTDVNSASGQELHLNIDNNQVVTLTSSENVGIGVTNPTNKLEVNGNTSILASTNNALTLNNTLTGVSLANADGSGILTDSSTTANYGLSIRENGTAILQVNNNGTVGIGGITSPNTELEVRDTIRVSNTNGDYIDINAETNNLQIHSNDLLSLGVSSNTLNIDINNNIGIGTEIPQQDLHVEGTQYISTSLGIGITTQTESLHVVGDGKVTGDFTIGGNLIFEGIAVDGLAIQDPLIKLGSNNNSDLVDSGLYSLYIDGGTTKFAGLFRDASDSGKYNLFHELEIEPGVTVNKSGTGFEHATLILDTLEFNTDVIGPLISITQANTVNLENTGTITTQNLNVTGPSTFIGDANFDSNTLYIDSSEDNVGIGTSTPQANLHVVGNTLLGELSTTDNLIKLATTNATDALDTGFYSQYNDGTNKFTGLFRDITDSKYRLFTGLEVEPTTTIDIGATGYTNTTLVVDQLEADTEVIAPEFTATCDRRVKENIQYMDAAKCAEKINKLGLYSYTYTKEFNKSDDRLYGLIAQDVEKHIPEAIKTKTMRFGNTIIDDFKTISQNTIIANLIGTVQYQNKMINHLVHRIKGLEDNLYGGKLYDN